MVASTRKRSTTQSQSSSSKPLSGSRPRAAEPPPASSSPAPSSGSEAALPRAPEGEYPPGTYKPTRSERFVFNTPPYSGHIKQFWRFKDAHAARASCDAIWALFEQYAAADDYVGMDTCRKFIQMGRTRSLRYALRPGGKKYARDDSTGQRVEMARDGTVHDQGKYDGAQVFRSFEGRCWRDGRYRRRWAEYGGRPVPVDEGESAGHAHAEGEQEGDGRVDRVVKREGSEGSHEPAGTNEAKPSSSPAWRGRKRKASPGPSDGDGTDEKPRVIDRNDDSAECTAEIKHELEDTPVKSEPPPSSLRSIKAEPDETRKRRSSKRASDG